MSILTELLRRREQLQRPNTALATLMGSTAPHLSRVFRGQKDPQASTLEALAAALDAQWVLIPQHLMPEVERLLSGKVIGPDNLPSAMEQLLQAQTGALAKASPSKPTGKAKTKSSPQAATAPTASKANKDG